MRTLSRPVALLGAAVLGSSGLALVASPASAVPPPCEVQPGLNVITGTAAGEMIRGTDGPDLIDGAGGRDTIFGLGGDDVLIGGAGDDRMIGGFGHDCLAGGAGDDRLEIGPGRDVAWGGDGNDWITILVHSTGRDHVHGGAGKDDTVEWWLDAPFDDDGTENYRGWYTA